MKSILAFLEVRATTFVSPFLLNLKLHFYQEEKKRNKEMNWIVLNIAGLLEVAFAFCLGKVKEIQK